MLGQKKNKLTFGPLSQEWTDHSIECKIPPRNIDEHLKRARTKEEKYELSQIVEKIEAKDNELPTNKNINILVQF